MSKLFEKVYYENNPGLPLFERIFREEHLREMANGQAIPTNAMTDYKKQGLSFEQIVGEIEHKLNNPETNSTFKSYKFSTKEQFDKDYDAIYGNRKTFNTPLGIQAHMGDEQKEKLWDYDPNKDRKNNPNHKPNHSRTGLLYTLQFVLEDPTVIIWERASTQEHKQGNSGTLIFAKSFSIGKGVKVVNIVTIDRESMRVAISNFSRDTNGFLERFLKKGNQVVYVKK